MVALLPSLEEYLLESIAHVFNEDFVVEVERFSIYSGYYDKCLTYFLIIWTAFLFSLNYP